MEERLQHDPRTKQQIKDSLYNFLYAPVLRDFGNRLEAIVIKNAVLIGSANHSFSYRGLYYTSIAGPLPRRMDRLAKALHPVMDSYLADLKQLNLHEVPMVLGYINKVLNSSNELHDYLKMFPSAIHSPIEGMIATCPCRTTGLSIEGMQAIQKQNQHTIDLIKTRLVINLIM